MAKNMFTKDEIADYYNANFINAKFDMEKGEGIELAKKYEVRCYPNLLFIDGDGNLVHRSAGAAQEAKAYIDLGERAKSENFSYSAIKRKYETTSSLTPEFMEQVIEVMSTTCLPYDKYVDEYFKILPPNQFTGHPTWKILFYHVNDYKNDQFKRFLSLRTEFEEKFGEDSVAMKINYTFKQSAQQLLYSKNFKDKQYDEFLNEVSTLKFKGSEELLLELRMQFFQHKEQWKEYFELAFSEKHIFQNPETTNSVCWDAYEKSSDQQVLEKAAYSMKKMLSDENNKQWMYMDTYAAILFKLKKKDEAKKIAQEAIELGVKEKIDEEELTSTKELLNKIEKL
jgi:hypothetical protein